MRLSPYYYLRTPNCVIEYDDLRGHRCFFLTDFVRDDKGEDLGVGVCPITWEALVAHKNTKELMLFINFFNYRGNKAILAYNKQLSRFEWRRYDPTYGEDLYGVVGHTNTLKIPLWRRLRATFFKNYYKL